MVVDKYVTSILLLLHFTTAVKAVVYLNQLQPYQPSKEISSNEHIKTNHTYILYAFSSFRSS